MDFGAGNTMLVYHKVKRAWCSAWHVGSLSTSAGWIAQPPSMPVSSLSWRGRDHDIKQVVTTSDAKCHERVVLYLNECAEGLSKWQISWNLEVSRVSAAVTAATSCVTLKGEQVKGLRWGKAWLLRNRKSVWLRHRSQQLTERRSGTRLGCHLDCQGRKVTGSDL